VPPQVGDEGGPARGARQVGGDERAPERDSRREGLLDETNPFDQRESPPAARLAALEIADGR